MGLRSRVADLLRLSGTAVTLGVSVSCAPEDAQEMQYDTVTAKIGDIRDIVPARGKVEAAAVARVSSEVSGRILTVDIQVEERVEAGDRLAAFDPGPFEARLNRAQSNLQVALSSVREARARLEAAEYELEVARRLAERGNTAEGRVTQLGFELEAREGALDRSQAQVSVARAELEQARLDLARVEIRSPIDGFVLERRVDPGDVVNAVQSAPQLFTIAANLDDVIIRAEVAERDIGRIDADMDIRFTVDAYPNAPMRAELVRIERAPIVNGRFVAYPIILSASSGGSGQVRPGAAEAETAGLLPGMTASVEFVRAESEEVLLAPIEAIFYTPENYVADIPQELLDRLGVTIDRTSQEAVWYLNGFEVGGLIAEGKQRIFVLQDGKPVRREVRVGQQDRENIAISGDEIEPGDEIVISESAP